jgi:hypothetical protein
MLAQACSDNNGSTGPTFACQETAVGQGKKSGSVNARSLNACTAPVSGVVNDIGDLLITVQANPGSTEPGRRVSIIVIVTNGNGAVGGSGQPLPGQRVFILASAGVVDGPTGTTDSNGIYSTTMLVRCEDTGPITVNASSGGAVSVTPAVIQVTLQGPNSPCPPPPPPAP